MSDYPRKEESRKQCYYRETESPGFEYCNLVRKVDCKYQSDYKLTYVHMGQPGGRKYECKS